ncbi:MAG TPA: ABC transporter ATP-binding protein [Flexilinea sp.]|jgi:branched-chain amino acid transport system ATP-binding protein|nr:ABC transporter ATP-binding protein [Flexilinea sp.]HOR56567.1 ABC transporter ATP-binding protein [Flexilinea sp.]HPJ65890.1 ABC transporter ATP-binding protein [Flexilinea sp.]HPL58059.1 ABC transporter ATP-binding protein [Flexilinea sp.]HQG89315.1 ABC transporter ATP-binding protein [Flexilinea sp.]
MMLSLENIYVNYGSIQVLHGINIEVNEGEIVTIIGANGAGKSTTLKAIAGLVTKTRNSSIKFMGEDITNLPPEKIVAKGISLAPEGRRIFPDLTVLENLEMGAYLRAKDKQRVKKDMESIFELFPILEQRRNQSGKTLSGGEQQMLAIARALMANPKLLMLDEPSTGLAPLIIKDIFGIIKQVNEKGTTVLLVEQNSKIALGIADRGYVLKNGVVVLQDTCENLMKNEEIKKAYLGEGAYANAVKG